jgi:hypothetical protein
MIYGDNQGYVNQGGAGLSGLLMVLFAVHAESKFLSSGLPL